MNMIHQPGEPDMRRLEEAAEWLLRLNNDDLSEAEVRQWLQWCDSPPDNLRVFDQLQKEWSDLDALTTKAPPRAVSRPIAGQAGMPRPRRRLLRAAGWGMAAGLAAIAALTAMPRLGGRQASERIAAAHANEVATLPDGSVVTLSAKTSVGVDFNGARRRLELSRGEAYFKVHHDTSHPFVVQAGRISVTAVGTAFDVRQELDRVIVTVEEGVVEVADPTSAEPTHTWRVGAGYQVAYAVDQRTATISSINPATVLKWRSGALAYMWEPLGAVVDDINRYSSRRIVFGDPALAQLHFTGTVFTASIDDWLAAIQAAYPLRAVDGPDREIILEDAGSSGGKGP